MGDCRRERERQSLADRQGGANATTAPLLAVAMDSAVVRAKEVRGAEDKGVETSRW